MIFSKIFSGKCCGIENNVYLCNPVWKTNGIFCGPAVRRGAENTRSSLKRLEGKYKQVPRKCNNFYTLNERRFRKGSVRFKLRDKNYTMKSLILAQDER